METVKVLNNKASKSVVWAVYIVIIFEMIYMSTPFAVFFYSVYGAPLKFLGEHSSTLWLVQNVLPHFTQTRSMLINTLLYMSWPLMGLGFLIFIVGFCQIYWAKFRRKGVVAGGLYRIIRHPQYAGWTLFGLGMAIFWSRMIVLIMYVSMLFVYYLLAIIEERECLKRYGDSYQSYLQRTGRFLPRIRMKNSIKPKHFLPQGGPARIAILIGIFFLSIGGTICLGFFVRAHTLSEISTSYERDAAVVALTPMGEANINSIINVSLGNQSVRTQLETLNNPSNRKRLIYIVPSEWRISELGMEDEVGHGHHHGFNPTNHGNPTTFDRNRYKVLVSEAVVDQDVEGKGILSQARRQKPLLLVHVDLKENRVTNIETVPKQSKYGDLPVPIF